MISNVEEWSESMPMKTCWRKIGMIVDGLDGFDGNEEERVFGQDE